VHQILLLSASFVMPMPSLFKYFLTVGGALIGVLFLANYLLEQPAPASAQNAAAPKAVVVKTDPQASRVERWRAEQAAVEALRKEEAARLASQPVEPEAKPVTKIAHAAAAKPANTASRPAATPAGAAPQTAAAPQAADVSLSATDAVAPDQPKLKSRKTARAEKTRNKHFARDDARGGSRERVASNQQDDYYYGQRQGYAQQGFGQRPGFAPAPSYAYAPQQSFGPFGGWGRGW
jgi:hypothetical protein